MAQHNKICQICNERGHSKFYCRNKPYRQIPKVSKKRLASPQTKKIPKQTHKIGKRAKKWVETSKLWKKENPPDEDGFWYCRVGGGYLSDKGDERAFSLNICHDQSRARHPELAFELDNLFPGCQRHNKEQGSRSLEEYLESEHEPFCGNF